MSRFLLIPMVEPSEPYAEIQTEREKFRDKFARIYNTTHPKAVETLSCDSGRMVPFYKFPKAHWWHRGSFTFHRRGRIPAMLFGKR